MLSYGKHLHTTGHLAKHYYVLGPLYAFLNWIGDKIGLKKRVYYTLYSGAKVLDIVCENCSDSMRKRMVDLHFSPQF